MGRLREQGVLRGLESLFESGVATGLSDLELLERFARCRDQAGELAFATLVARHGPMVQRVCRRMLTDPADADDAFQATFLVLVRRAGSIRCGDSLGPWLYGVSARVARRVRLVKVRRPLVALDEDATAAIPDRRSDDRSRLESRLAIDEALAQLPSSYREAIVLCHLEGLTHQEAAERSSCPVGTIRSRLARGRILLRKRLAGWGLAPAGWMSHAYAPSDGNAAPPLVAPHLIENTARAAARLAAGRPMAEIVPARLTEIVAGVVRIMVISKLATAVLLLAVAALTAWAVSGRAASQAPDSRPAPVAAARPAPPVLTAAAAQPPGNPPRTERSRQEERNRGAELHLLAEYPAVVVNVEPKLGAADVDPGLREIRVTFSKRMKDRNWSWVTYEPDQFPKVEGTIHYEKDGRTCVLPVKLEPGKTYWIGINAERFHNFKDLNGRPAMPYQVVFRTKATR